jgi:hypothetical protein
MSMLLCFLNSHFVIILDFVLSIVILLISTIIVLRMVILLRKDLQMHKDDSKKLNALILQGAINILTFFIGLYTFFETTFFEKNYLLFGCLYIFSKLLNSFFYGVIFGYIFHFISLSSFFFCFMKKSKIQKKTSLDVYEAIGSG